MMDNENGYKKFIKELEKPGIKRKGFVRKRKNPFSISDVRINELYDTYFSELSINHSRFSIGVDPNDFEEIVYLLRVHFQLWIEIKGNHITIYQDFPQRYRVIKEVNIENHTHTPVSIPAGTIMDLSVNSYGVVNYSSGIPLKGKILTENDKVTSTLNASLQINYPFLEALH